MIPIGPSRRLLVADLVLAQLAGGLTLVLLARWVRWPWTRTVPVAVGVALAVLLSSWLAEVIAPKLRARGAGVEAGGDAGFFEEVLAAGALEPHVQLVIGAVPWEPAGFRSRSGLLARIELATATGRPAVVCNLAGTSGVGKTQLAGAYARLRVEQGCPLVIWVAASTRAQLLIGLAAAADRLGVGARSGDSAESAAQLRLALEAGGEQALVVFDDATDAELVAEYAPAAGGVEVVVTTTQRTFDELGRLVEVAGYERAESVAYLAAATGLAQSTGAAAVARALADHPLALAQAAAVTAARRLHFRGYAALLAGTPRVIVRTGKPYPAGAAEAIALSVLAAEQTDPAGPTVLLLGLLAVLSTDGVPRSFLDPLPVRSGELSAALNRIADANLAGWAGVPSDPAGETLVMHRLVARVIRERAHQAGELPEILRAASGLVRLVAIAVAEGTADPEQARHLPEQATAVWDAGRMVWPTLKRADPALTEIFAGRRAAVRHLVDGGDLSAAAEYGADTLADAVRFLGPANPDTRGLRSILAGAAHAREPH